ncbi:MAG: hypothetical protein JNJ88_08690 [Planctomycetes bacterium]|nr:hypothetical protein [Planctomycetota bacterium]
MHLDPRSQALACAAALTALLTAPSASAAAPQATLELNGATAITLPPGAGLIANGKLPAGKPGGILFDESAGPFSFLGELVPLGFTAATSVLAGPLTIPPSGSLVVSTIVPPDPALLGRTFHFVAFAVDASDPNGIVFSNGASLLVQKVASAGPNLSAFVGDQVVLDGSANAASGGLMAPGEILAWQLIAKPAGSASNLANTNTQFPHFTPDVAGNYTARVTLYKNGVPLSSDETTIHAFAFNYLTPLDGAILSGATIPLFGQLQPKDEIAAFAIDGVPTVLSSLGSFTNFVGIPWIPGQTSRPITYQILASDGSVATRRMSALRGAAVSTATPLPQSVRVQMTQQGLDKVETLVLGELNALNLSQIVTSSVPAQEIADIFIATAYAKPTGASHGPYGVTFTPTTSNIGITITISNLYIPMSFWGTLFGIGWSSTGYLRADLVTIKTNATFPIVNGALTVSLSPAQISISGFSYDVSGIPFDIDQAFTGTVYDAALSALNSAIQPMLSEVLGSGFAIDFTDTQFGLLNKLYSLQLRFESVTHTTSGVSATANGYLASLLPPTGPSLPVFVSSGAPLPTFGTTAPGGAAYHVGTGARVDALNLFLSRLASSGLANQHLDTIASAYALGFGETPFQAQELAQILPSAGFELLPPTQLVRVKLTPTVAPVVSVNSSGPALLHAEFPGVRFEFRTTVPGSLTDVPILSLMLDVQGQLTTNLNPATSALAVGVQSLTVNATLLSGLPSVDLLALGQGIQQVGSVLGSLLAGALTEFTLPSFDFDGVAVVPIAMGPFGGTSGAAAWTLLQ